MARLPRVPAARRSSVPWIACPRCGGTGRITMYSHINGGICFRCGGAGRVIDPDRVDRAFPWDYSSPMPDKVSIIDAALADGLSYMQLCNVLSARRRYGFTLEEVEMLEHCKFQLRPE